MLQFSCSKKEVSTEEDDFPLQYINIWRNGKTIDTTYSVLNSITYKDSIYYLDYTEIDFDGDTIQRQYELPISNSKRTFKLLKDTSELRLKYRGLRYLKYDKDYTAYKYLYDDPNGEDEEMNIYLIPEYGIVIVRSRAWGSYGRLVNNSKQTDFDKIFYLTEKIVGDFHDFYFPTEK